MPNEEEMTEIVKTKTIDGTVYVRGKCSCCKQCWIALGGKLKGKCMAGGPFGGYVKDKDWEQQHAPKDRTLPTVQDGGERPPWE